MRRKVELRVVLQDGERKAMALGATLLEKNDLYRSSPLKGGVDNQLFKATIHEDGKTHVRLPDREALLKGEPVEPVDQ